MSDQTQTALSLPESPFSKRILAAILSEMAGIGAIALLFYHLQASDATQSIDPWSGPRLFAYALLFSGPLLIFAPPSIALRLGPTWLLGAGSWALLGFVLLFVAPPGGPNTSFFTYAAFLTLLLVALTSALAILMAALGRLFLPEPPTPVSGMARALRQGGLLALTVVSLIAMSPLGLLSWLNTLLLCLIAALTEFFFMTRD